jgi:cytosine/adenosine deaminase-related metal-dependent hydrolase
VTHVIGGGMVLAGPDFEVLDPGYLVIEDGRIAEVGTGRPPAQAGPVLDACDTIAAPPETVRAGIEDALDYMVACGTSTFCDSREGGRAGVRLLRAAAAGRPIRAVALGRFGAFPPLGSIDRGKRADLVLLDRRSTNLGPVHDPVAAVVHRAEPRDIRAVLFEGRVVHGALEAGR